jgi:N6-L-threonylcarbamoyladenine synthase
VNILAIETSCDETAICYLKAAETPAGIDFSVEANITHSQLEHVAYGGVFPGVGKREHQINLPIILEKIMKDQEKPDVICVTNGPGLEPALWCGIVFAQELGKKWNIPVVPVNHMEGHILSVLVPVEQTQFVFENTIQFPALALLISGGHTELVLVNNIGDYKIIGKTRDDAVGEAFDKVARVLGLPYPGGVAVSKLAAQAREKNLPMIEKFPRPMIHSKDYDFSFSGLKTAVLYFVQNITNQSDLKISQAFSSLGWDGSKIPDETKQAIACEFEDAVTEVLVKKTARAIEEFTIQTLIIGGGVAANKHITESLGNKINQDFPSTKLFVPTKGLTGDNALMIALAGYFKIQKNPDATYGDIKAVGNLSL